MAQDMYGDETHTDQAEARALFLEAMSRVAAPVGIVVTNGPAGRYGITVSSVVSVSADPPMVLACINQRSPIAGPLAANRLYTVNMLSPAQAEMAERFAGRDGRYPAYDFGCGAWQAGTQGEICLDDAIATLTCTPEQVVQAGTHVIVIGRVLRTVVRDASALLYCRREFCRPVGLSASA
ncbi:flavin reductase family protein [Gluconacetobacter azotocaptans]|nr:flavin reductase family protein [Gluconacetobacter azotocaptans]GBQ26132.1 flavin reductase domain-containing protein [Gluconacetobacter azotocaptans DSM 13594]